MARTRSCRQLAWEKSKGICCLCGYPMLIEGPENGPLVYTIEHILPRARGGTNDIDNLDGSHKWCNQYKGDSLMEELPKDYRKFLKWKIRNFIANQKVVG